MIYILYIYSLRLQNMFQQLERVGGKAAKNQAGEELQQMRYATCKIYQILCTQGKIWTVMWQNVPSEVGLAKTQISLCSCDRSR